jgi:hypothetical protein
VLPLPKPTEVAEDLGSPREKQLPQLLPPRAANCCHRPDAPHQVALKRDAEPFERGSRHRAQGTPVEDTQHACQLRQDIIRPGAESDRLTGGEIEQDEGMVAKAGLELPVQSRNGVGNVREDSLRIEVPGQRQIQVESTGESPPESQVAEESEKMAITVHTIGDTAIGTLALVDEGETLDVKSTLRANVSGKCIFVNVELDLPLGLWATFRHIVPRTDRKHKHHSCSRGCRGARGAPSRGTGLGRGW